jgi:tetratricopeptide (TPR) repeat protein
MNRHWDKAIDYFSDDLKTNPNNIEALSYRALSYSFAGKYDEAIVDFNELIILDPQNSSTYYNNRGLAHLRKKDFNRALEDFDRILQKDSSHFAANTNKALALVGTGQMDEALAIYDKLIRNTPAMNVYWSRGMLYSSLKQYKEAIADYTTAINLYKPGSCDAVYHSRGIAYREAGDCDNAVDDFNKAIKINSHIGTFYFEKAFTLDKFGRTNEALIAYKTFLSLPSREIVEQVGHTIMFGIWGSMLFPVQTKYYMPDEQKKYAEERVRILSSNL